MKINITLIVLTLLLSPISQQLFAQTDAEIEQMINDDQLKPPKKGNIKKAINQRGREINAKVKAEKRSEQANNTALDKEKVTPKNKSKSNKNIANQTNALSNIPFKKLYKIGDKLVESGSFYNGITYYEEALSKAKKPKDIILLNKQIADANFALRDYQAALKHYQNMHLLNASETKFPYISYQMANSYKYLGNYDSAMIYYNQFLDKQEKNEKIPEAKKRTRLEIKGIEYALENKINEKYIVENAGENVNGAYSDYGPEWKDNQLYFSKIYTDKVVVLDDEIENNEYSKIYYSPFYNEKFDVFQDFSNNINTDQIHVGNTSFSADGNSMYFTECVIDKSLQSNCKIAKSERINNEWQKPIYLNNDINLEKTNNTQPQIVALNDGSQMLYFVSNRAGGRGGKDIWSVTIDKEGNFSKAINIGYPINTVYDELSPYFHSASNTLYFSSNGHPSIGGFDIFSIQKNENAEWNETPTNLNAPINSSLDDYDFVLNNNEDLGFLSSNRPGGLSLKSETCCDDIYILKPAFIEIYVTGLVYAENMNNRQVYEKADLYLFDKESFEKIEQINYQDGKPYITKIEKDKNYAIKAMSNDFDEVEIAFSTYDFKKSDTLHYDLFLKERNLVNYMIGKVYYQFDASKLREDAPDTLRKVITFMNAYPEVIVEIASHTDAKGSDEYNLKLSERRSLSVKNYLINEGKITENRLINKWFGESMPVAPNTLPDGTDNEAGRDLNRRTEFKIIGNITNP